MSAGDFLPFLGTTSAIDGAIQAAQGAVASVLGISYDVYRLSDTTNVGIVSGSPLYVKYPASIRRTTAKVAIKNTTFDLIVSISTSDNRSLLKGDILVENGTGGGGSNWAYVQRTEMQETLLVRCEANIFISRPATRSGASNQQPVSGPLAVAMPQRGGTYKAIERVVELSAGDYALSNIGDVGVTPANIPCGLQPLNRIKDAKDPRIPSVLYREHFLAWLPLMPGFQPNELDRLNFPNSDRYEIALVYTSEQTDLEGFICIVEKLGV